MRKIATILMLVAVFLIGVTVVDAKTTKKKSKARTTRSVSAQWNEDIPSASIIEQFFMSGLSEAQKSKYRSQFIDHGYHFEDYESIAIKEGVCEIEFAPAAQTMEIYIVVYDSELRNWLYNDIRSLIKSKKSNSRFYNTYVNGNTICFGHSKWSYT